MPKAQEIDYSNIRMVQSMVRFRVPTARKDEVLAVGAKYSKHSRVIDRV